jgi:hypothetical protein
MPEVTRDWKAEREQHERAEHANRVAHAMYASDYKPIIAAVERLRDACRHDAVGMMSATERSRQAVDAARINLANVVRQNAYVVSDLLSLLIP